MEQDERREVLAEWLKTIQRDRHWLAEKIAVKKSTVDSWFSTRRISEAMWHSLESLMASTGASPLGDLLEVTLTLEEFEELEKARLYAAYESRSAFYRDAILDYTRKLLDAPPASRRPTGFKYGDIPPPQTMLVNEPGPE
jgi:hypothetical protein